MKFQVKQLTVDGVFRWRMQVVLKRMEIMLLPIVEGYLEL
jgi:hypothetical protein